MFTFLALAGLIAGLLVLKAWPFVGAWLLVFAGFCAYKATTRPHDMDGFMASMFFVTVVIGAVALVSRLLG